MGSITTGIGLISGINTAQLIDQLIAFEGRGKVVLESRLGRLQTQKTALLDISARLKNLRDTAKTYRADKIFQSALAASSDDTILTATATTSATPGTYQFLVRQLVSTSQLLSKGFANADLTPLGLDSLSLEFGQGRLARDVEVSELNGGLGAQRGKIVITTSGSNTATIDLREATTINEVVSAINDAAGIDVTATVEGDHLVVTENTGASLTIADATGYTTASDLGIAGSSLTGVITGTEINTIGGDFALARLNDGNGVLIRDNVADIRITARDGSIFEIDFGRQNVPITASTNLSDLNNGDGVALNDSEEDPDIKFIARDGTEFEVDLTGVTTIGQLISRVSSETSGHIALSITDGDKLTVTDTVGGAGLLKVLGAGPGGDDTADDLGILNEAGIAADTFDGSVIPSLVQSPQASTIQEIIDRINSAEDTAAGANAGRIVASIAADGVSLQITDATGGGGNLIVTSTAANPYAARDLGIDTGATGVAASTVAGQRLIASLNSVLTRNLNGGTGLGGATSIAITDRSGASFSLANLDTFDSVSDLIDAINDAAAAGSVDVAVSLNASGNGLRVTDTSGGSGNLIVTGDGAESLGIATDGAGVADSSIKGDNLQLRYVSEAATLDELNYGRGVGTGKFRIYDGFGDSAEVDIGSDATSLYDVIAEINSRGLKINARINDHGDGLLIEHSYDPLVDGEPSIALRVENITGTAARDLGILSTASSITEPIDGSYEKVVDLEVTDNLNQVIKKINDAPGNIPVNASILNSGSGGAPFHLTLSSEISGLDGDLIIDSGDVDLGFTVLSKAQNAKIFFGSSDPGQAVLVSSSSNTLSNVVQGLTIQLHSTSEDAVTLNVARDTEKIKEAVKQLVVTINDVIGRIDQYDFFDVDTEERGPLLGNPVTSRVRSEIFRILQGPAQGVSGEYRFLSQIGIKPGTDGEIKFDEAKFLDAYAENPEAVEELIAGFESTTSQTEQIAEGITVSKTTETATLRGFGELFTDLMELYTDPINGVVTLADKGFQDQIELINDRIERIDERLEAKRLQLEQQFLAMEAALAKIQGQGGALAALQSNVAMAQAAAG
jgi:flagellar hook-associated protein 2